MNDRQICSERGGQSLLRREVEAAESRKDVLCMCESGLRHARRGGMKKSMNALSYHVDKQAALTFKAWTITIVCMTH